MKDKVLLTGASGFLGNAIKQELSSSIDLVTLGRSSSNQLVVDLAKGKPDILTPVNWVIHAAGHAHVVPRSDEQKKKFFQVNVDGTKHLLDELDKIVPRIKAFVFISSVAVYGKETGNNITEEEQLLGSSSYALSKIEAEKLISDWCLKNQIKLSILRLPLLVGKNPPGNLGSMIRWMKRSLYISIGSGQCRKSMVLVNDVAQFIPRVALIGGTYNLTDGYNPTMAELEEALAKHLGVRKPIRVPNKVISGFAKFGDLLGHWFPINSITYTKLTNELTFSDELARRKTDWSSNSVISNLSKNV
jgi:nucleoside-diphosphate-sugar epimerase